MNTAKKIIKEKTSKKLVILELIPVRPNNVTFNTVHYVPNENVEGLQAKMAATLRWDQIGVQETPFLTPDRKPLLRCLKWTRSQLQMTGTKLT